MVRKRIGIDNVHESVRILDSFPDASKVSLRTRPPLGGRVCHRRQQRELRGAGETIPRTHTIRSDRPLQFGGGDSGCTRPSRPARCLEVHPPGSRRRPGCRIGVRLSVSVGCGRPG